MKEQEKDLIRADYLKTWVTTVLAIIAGEVTLLNTVYKSSDLLWILYLSIMFFMLAIILCLGAYEGVVNKVTGLPSFRSKVLQMWIKCLPKTAESIWLLSAVGGVLLGLGLGSAFIFIMLART
jgi:hypothetical protein